MIGRDTLRVHTSIGIVDIDSTGDVGLHAAARTMGLLPETFGSDAELRDAIRAAAKQAEVHRSNEYIEARALELLLRDEAARRRAARPWLWRLFDRLFGE